LLVEVASSGANSSVARDSERLGRLVNDLLGLARLEAHPTRAPVDLAAIARPLVEEAHARASQAEITLRADADTTVRGDPTLSNGSSATSSTTPSPPSSPPAESTCTSDGGTDTSRRLSQTTDPAYPKNNANASSNASSDSTPADPAMASA
jgi:hypothetical protein